MNRRDFVAGTLIGATMARIATAQDSTGTTDASVATITGNANTPPTVEKAASHDFDRVVALAKQLSTQPYKDDKLKMVGPFRDLSYDQYRGIRFKRSADPFGQNNNGFGMDLLPPGRYYQDRVRIFLVSPDKTVSEILFTLDAFDFDPNLFVSDNLKLSDTDKTNLSWSGFRLRFPINNSDVQDEFVVFQGASYFRAVAHDTLYGLSARGLAIKTGDPSGEEFPRFSRFWIYRPQPGARSIQVDALLESPSITGAYTFQIFPGSDTVFMVKCSLFPRRDIVSYGIAPLTSMYYFSPTRRKHIDDYRNAVHDSDSLVMHTGQDTRLFRSLANPNTLQFSAFIDNNPKGFGFLQRARQFHNYEDAEARYEKRPSAWVIPIGNWGKGNVSLIEIPADSEFNDNIISFWNGAQPLKAGERSDYAYDLIWNKKGPGFNSRAKIISSRIGKSVNDTTNSVYSIIIDYQYDDGRVPNLEGANFAVTATKGTILSHHCFVLPDNRTIRASFDYRPDKSAPAELQAGLSVKEQAIAETWMYRWINN